MAMLNGQLPESTAKRTAREEARKAKSQEAEVAAFTFTRTYADMAAWGAGVSEVNGVKELEAAKAPTAVVEAWRKFAKARREARKAAQ